MREQKPRQGVFMIFSVVAALCIVAGLSVFASFSSHASQVGTSNSYLAIGDSLAFGFQPDLHNNHSYVDALYSNLRSHGINSMANLSCPGETTTTFIKGGCPLSSFRKYSYQGAQLTAALRYLALHRGQVRLVTLDIGADDIFPDINRKTCALDTAKFPGDLATLDANLTAIILPQIHNALLVNGKLTSDIVMMNYYDPYQNACPKTLPYVQELNQHLARDASGYGMFVDVFGAFGGSPTPNPNICKYTWMCTPFQNIHATDAGYRVIATTFEKVIDY